MNRRHSVFECESGKFVCATIENRISSDEKASRSWLDQFRKHRLEVALGVGVKDLKFEPERAGRGINALHDNVGYDHVGGVKEHRKSFGLGKQFV